MLHLQAVIIMATSLAALAAGYFIGRGSRIQPGPAQAPDVVTVAGHVSFATAGAPAQPDAQAVVIAFPEGAIPADKIPVAGLRPDDAGAPQAGSAAAPSSRARGFTAG